MNRNNRAFTLSELLVVTAIVCVLVAISWLLIGPMMKTKSVEARIRSDLKQIVSAINIYMADYDGELPTRQEVLPKGTPTRIDNLPRHGSVGQNEFGGNLYFYTQPYRMQVFSAKFAKYPWDSGQDPIVKAQMRLRPLGKQVSYLDFDSTCSERTRAREEVLLLGARLDGSIHWFPVTQTFELEFAACSWKLGRTK